MYFVIITMVRQIEVVQKDFIYNKIFSYIFKI